MKKAKLIVASLSTILLLTLNPVSFTTVLASGTDCPVGLVNNLTLDDEFGPGTSAITRCLVNKKKLKIVFQINNKCKNSACTKPYAVGNIENAIKDIEITNGIKRGDYEIVAVVHSGGFSQILNNNAALPNSVVNKFQMEMEAILEKGVKVYFCQNTARSKSVKTGQLIAGVEYVTAGVTSISDFQKSGYRYVQP